MRRTLLEPIPELYLAAKLLDATADALLLDNRKMASALIVCVQICRKLWNTQLKLSESYQKKFIAKSKGQNRYPNLHVIQSVCHHYLYSTKYLIVMVGIVVLAAHQ